MNKHPSNVSETASNKPASNATAFVLPGTAVAPYRAFTAALSNGDTCPVHASNGTDWQDFVGTFNAGTLAQTTLLESSTGTWINWSAGADVLLEIAWLGAHGEDTDAHLNDASKHLPPSPTLGQMVVQSDAGPVWVNYATVLNNTLAPVVSGSTGYGNVLTCTTGTWAGFGSISYAYQWYNGATILSGETTSTYTTVYGDVGDAITCTVTATDTLTSASANSNAVTVTDSPLELSQFYAPLTNSLILTRGTGNPTYTRATTAWEFDNEGKLITVPSGASRHGGARMVRNLLAYSQDFSNAYWGKLNCVAGAPDPVGLSLLTPSSHPSFIYKTGIVTGIGADVCVSASFKKGTSTDPVLRLLDYAAGTNLGRIVIDWSSDVPVAGATVGDVRNITITDEGDGEYRVSFVTNTGTSNGCSYYSYNSNGANLNTFYTGRAQLENVTGQADQTASEYVSVGVLSAPYHGAGVDGVKWFDTNKDGSAISAANLLGYHAEGARTNNLLYSRNLRQYVWGNGANTGSEKITNGDFATGDLTGWTNTSTGSGTASVVSGAAQLYRVDSSNFGCISAQISAATESILTITKSDSVSSLNIQCGSAVINSATVVGSILSAGTYTIKLPAGDWLHLKTLSNGQTAIIDNVSVKEAAIQVTTCTGIDNAANSASTLTAGAANATILQTLTLASAARSSSAYVKRRTGTGTISFTRNGGTTWTDITSQINSSTWTRVKIENTSVTNPSIGFMITTSGDAIDVDVVQDEAGAFASSPIITTTAAVTRNADNLYYDIANIIDTSGAFLVSATPNWPNANGTDCGFIDPQGAGNGLGRYSGGSLQWHDSTTTYRNFSPSINWDGSAARKFGVAWSSGSAKGTYDGSTISSIATISLTFGGNLYLASNSAGAGHFYGYIKQTHIWQSALTDSELQAVTA